MTADVCHCGTDLHHTENADRRLKEKPPDSNKFQTLWTENGDYTVLFNENVFSVDTKR